jgi:hypothetical protein
MKNQILKVEESKTYQVYNRLLDLGFNANLVSMFSHSYDEENSYLAIIVREAEERLNELYEVTNNMEVVLTKYSNEISPCFEVRKDREYAEFIQEEVWLNYYSSL